ncbi:N-6 DNA methylase [Streptomyces sp. SM14]|uniref:N-6 DNA methylase n=1 Tax=Streptomyces sp. SM14 TaxID=1736045 RepID=UPI0021561D1B|nr:N-6 DNA methylase [Streptomyces sp. SM14]
METVDTRGLADIVGDRLWRAYLPFQRGRNTFSDLTSMLAILLLGQFAITKAESRAAFLTPWKRALAEKGEHARVVEGLGAALRGASAHPDFPLRGARSLGYTTFDSSEAHDDSPWVTSFLVATKEAPTPYEVGITAVCDHLIERQQDEGGVASGEFHPPRAVSRLLAELVSPEPGDRVLDPACGLGGPLAAAADHIASRGGLAAASFEAHVTDRGNVPLATLNLAVHGVELPAVGVSWSASVPNSRDSGPFDRVLSNPPFNQRRPKQEGEAWPFGEPTDSNANFAWLQHAWMRLSQNGIAAVIMPPGAAWSKGGEAIRQRMVARGAVLGIVALPPGLFAQTAIPVHIWLLTRDAPPPLSADRSRKVLFIDATQLGIQGQRRRRLLTDDDVNRISQCFLDWRERPGSLAEEPDFSRSLPPQDLLDRGARLDPRHYVRAGARRESGEDDGGSLSRKLVNCSSELQRSAEVAEQRLAECAQAALCGQTPPTLTLHAIAAVPEPRTIARDPQAGLFAGPSGSLIPASQYVEPGPDSVPVVMPQDISGGGFSTEKIKYVPLTYTEMRLPRFRLRVGDVVIARRGELGRCAVVRDAQSGWVCGTGCFVLRPPSDVDPDYIAAYLRSKVAREWLDAHSTGSMTMKTISQRALGELPVVLPDLGIQHHIAEAMRSVEAHAQQLREQLALTRRIREEVLHKILPTV